MALPLAATISAAARRALPIIQRGVREGLSSRAINDVIKSAFGRGIRRQTLLDVMRAERGIVELAPQLKRLGRLKRPNINRLPLAVTRIRRRLSFIVQIRGFIADVGNEIIQQVTVSTDVNLTRQEIEDLAAGTIRTGQSGTMVEIEDVTLISGVRAGRPGTF